jgi:hypothetical protein
MAICLATETSGNEVRGLRFARFAGLAPLGGLLPMIIARAGDDGKDDLDSAGAMRTALQ